MGVIGDILETMGMPRDGFELMMGIEIPKEHRPSFKPTRKNVAPATTHVRLYLAHAALW